MSTSNYIYPSAKIRALEPKILDQTDIERMVDAPDFNSAFKVLNDTDYADNLLEVEPLGYRRALSDDYRQLYELLKNITPDPNLFELIFLDRDLVNIKLLFKAKYFKQNVDGWLKENCVYPAAYLKEFVFNQKDKGLSPEIKNLIAEAKKQINEASRPDFIDTILTKEYFKLIRLLAEKIKSQLIADLIKIQINNANILTWLRAKRLGLEKDRLAAKLIPGGQIDTNKLLKLYGEEIKSLRELIGFLYDQAVSEVFNDYCEQKQLFYLEKSLEDFKTRFAQKAQLIASGPEVIYAYYLAKQNAVADIRIIMTGKLNLIPAEEIKKTLRQVR